MLRNQQGFTLIELALAVAILGLVAALAIPSYQDYIARTQMNRVFGELSGYRTPFEINWNTSAGITNQSLGYTVSDLTTGDALTPIAQQNPDGTGHLQVTLGGRAHQNLSGTIIRFQRSVAGEWSCTIDKSAASGWKASYTPGDCTVL